MNITSILLTINVVSVSNQVSLVSGKSPAVVKSLISKKSSASTVSTSITGVSQQILKFSSRLSVPFSPVREASNLKQSETRNNYIPRFLRNKNNPHGSFFYFLAEARGFEPPRHCCPHDFESCAFNHSATLPLLILSHPSAKDKP